MTAPGWQVSGRPQPTGAQIRCLRCGRIQPPLPAGVHSCVYCAAPLPVQRWRATPPPGMGLPLRRAARPQPYLGPPRYATGPPRWGFPPVIWRDRRPAAPAPAANASPALRRGAVVASLTAVVALTAAAAETWRYILMLRGRTRVLSGGQVQASDRWVAASGWTLLGLALLTAGLLIPALVTAHGQAAVERGHRPARPPAGVLARLVIPGWNVYGAGQVLAEIDRQLPGGRTVADAPATSRLVLCWWAAWVVDTVLVAAALLRAFGTSSQAVADTVELHIAVDLAAAVVAALTTAVGLRMARALSPRSAALTKGWTFRTPEPTSSRGQPSGDRRPNASGAGSTAGGAVAGPGRLP